MQIIPAKTTDVGRFLKYIGSSAYTFTYFQKRPIDTIRGHIVTLLGVEDTETAKPICYGHLEKENNIVWLGICVIESQKGKGYGKQMMAELIEKAKEKSIKNIRLSVHKTNQSAISLYQKYGFNKISETEKSDIMELTLP